MADDYDVEDLGNIPLDSRIRADVDAGKPTVMADPDGAIADIYRRIARRVGGKLAVRKRSYSDVFPSIVIENNCAVLDMSIKSDRWIRAMALTDAMIEPFEAAQVSSVEGRPIVSYGTSSYGYDIRCSREFKIFTNINSADLDTLNRVNRHHGAGYGRVQFIENRFSNSRRHASRNHPYLRTNRITRAPSLIDQCL